MDLLRMWDTLALEKAKRRPAHEVEAEMRQRGLVKRTVVDAKGRRTSKWVREDEAEAPAPKKGRAASASPPASSGPLDVVHHHLGEAERALRDAGHHEHADVVSRMRKQLANVGKQVDEGEKFDPRSIPAISIFRRGGGEPALRQALEAVPTTADLRAVARSSGVGLRPDARKRNASRETLIDAIVEGAREYAEHTDIAARAGMEPVVDVRAPRDAEHPLEQLFLGMFEQTNLPRREQFIAAVEEDAVRQWGSSFQLDSQTRTMPKLLERYSSMKTEPELRELFRGVQRRFRLNR